MGLFFVFSGRIFFAVIDRTNKPSLSVIASPQSPPSAISVDACLQKSTYSF